MWNASSSPNSITATFTKTAPQGKSWTQIMKVADTNHLDMSRCLRQSPWQSPRQVPDKVADLLRTQITKVGDVICVADFHDLCRDFVRNLSPTLSQNRRNGIWALAYSPLLAAVKPSKWRYSMIWCYCEVTKTSTVENDNWAEVSPNCQGTHSIGLPCSKHPY